MKALFLEHDHLSPPGPLADRLEQRGYAVHRRVVVPAERYSAPDVSFDYPDPDEFDIVICMGAPWGAWDDAQIGTWLGAELEWLRILHARRVPLLGVCFGGQALARALGGSVARGPRPEIGFTYVISDAPHVVPPGPWFQFHYDRWTVPPGALEIARTPLASQAFHLDRSLAVQFHPEVTTAVLSEWCRDEVLAVRGTRAAIAADGQDFDELVAQVAAEEQASILRAHRLIDAFLDHVATDGP